MKKTLITLSILACMNSLNAQSLNCEDWFSQNGPKTTGQVGPGSTGAVMTKDGSQWEKLFASGESTYIFDDRNNIRKAVKKATMRAKASFAKFLTEGINTTDTQEEISKTIEKLQKNSNGNQSASANQESVSIMTETISNSAQSLLKGVITICSSNNADDKYVQVVVGISKNTMKIADSVKNDLKKDHSVEQDSNSSNSNNTYKNKSSLKTGDLSF